MKHYKHDLKVVIQSPTVKVTVKLKFSGNTLACYNLLLTEKSFSKRLGKRSLD